MPRQETLIELIKEKLWDDANNIIINSNPTSLSKILNETDSWGNNALHVACRRRAPDDIILPLLSHPDAPSLLTMRDNYGCTPLHESVLYMSDDVTIRMIKACPIAAGMMNNVERTPIEWARERNRSVEVVKKLEIASRFEEYQTKSNTALLAGNNVRAIQLYTKLIEFDDSSHLNYFVRSAAYSMSGDDERALIDIEHSIDLYPHYAKAYARKGGILHKLGRYDEGIAAFEEGLDNFPDDIDILTGLSHLQDAKTSFESEQEKTNEIIESKELSLTSTIQNLERELEITIKKHEWEIEDVRSDNDKALKDHERDTSKQIQELRLYIDALEENERMVDDISHTNDDPNSEINKLRLSLQNMKHKTKEEVNEVKRRAGELIETQESMATMEMKQLKKAIKLLKEEKRTVEKELSRAKFRLREDGNKLESIQRILSWSNKEV